jgi:hypothetical protein
VEIAHLQISQLSLFVHIIFLGQTFKPFISSFTAPVDFLSSQLSPPFPWNSQKIVSLTTVNRLPFIVPLHATRAEINVHAFGADKPVTGYQSLITDIANR